MTPTATQKPIDRVLLHLKGVKEAHSQKYGDYFTACCPSHTDQHRSLEVWEDAHGHVGVKCFAGCSYEQIVQSIGLEKADFRSNARRAKQEATAPIELIDLAEDKLIPPAFFISLGCYDGEEIYHTKEGKPYKKKGIIIPYPTQDNKPHTRRRLRTALVAKEGSYWSEGTEDLILFGLQRLDKAREARYIVLEEGETDWFTLQLHKIPCLGLPGADMAGLLQLDYLTDIDRVYVMQETDKAGRALPENVYRRLQEIGYQGKVYALDLHKETGAKDPNDLHKRDMKAFKKEFEKAMQRARPLSPVATFVPKISSMRDLLSKKLAPPKWAVRELIPEGATILAGKPKMGKSWMILQIGLALATAGIALNKIEVERGDVRYLALEDNERRLQSRLLQLLADSWNDSLGCFDYVTEWARLNEGGLDAIEAWLEQHPQARMVVIDTLAKVRPRHMNKASMYDDDYADVAGLKALADRYHCAIVLIHHLRKMGAGDPLDEISGSTGLTGAVDNLLVLKRERGQADAVLHVTGRDVDEQELALTFSNQTGLWTLAGDAENFRLSQERQEIIDVIHDLTRQCVATTPLEILMALTVSREDSKKKSRESVRY